MRKRILRILIGTFIGIFPQFSAIAQETVFAGYFDIPTDSPAGIEVTGRIHLERNKDVLTSPIPKGYRFEIIKQPKEHLFRINTQHDLSKRIMGVLAVNKGKTTGSQPSSYHLVVALKDGNKQVEEFNVNVRIVKKTLWTTFNERYTPGVINNQRLYGRIKYSDDEIANILLELKRNNGQFEGERCYTAHPQEYEASFDDTNTYLPIQLSMIGLKSPTALVVWDMRMSLLKYMVRKVLHRSGQCCGKHCIRLF